MENTSSVLKKPHVSWWNAWLVLLGGACGALCRFYGNISIMESIPMLFPLGILCINVLGCFLMGLLQGSIKRSGSPHTLAYSLLGTGFLGGFTTFSTFSLDTLTLGSAAIAGGTESHLLLSCLNIILNVVLCITAAGFGFRSVMGKNMQKS